MSVDPRLPALFAEARDLDAEARARWLADLAVQEPGLASSLARLLENADQPASAWDAPAWIHGALDDSLATPERIGRYRVVREIGRGGMGRVFLAEERTADFERTVAVKVLDRAAPDEHAVRRFRDELRILARLEHPGIARLLDGGLDENGLWYLALEYVEGQDLLGHAESRSLGLESRLSLLLEILAAVGHAHSRLVVHSDIKPGNLIVGADGRPRLLDFGISRLLDDAAELDAPSHAARALTPAYASPEQLRGEAATTATDIYSLGIVLYELLARKHPFRERGEASTLGSAVDARSRLVPPSEHAPERRRVQGDLDAITCRALDPDPANRYATAAAMADDLRRFLGHEPVAARGGGALYATSRFVRRHRWAVAAITAACMTFLLGAGGYALWRVRRAEIERQSVARELASADALHRYLTMLFRDAAVSGSDRSLREVLRDGAEHVLERAPGGDSERLDLVARLADLFIAAEDTEGAAAMLERALEWRGTDTDRESRAMLQGRLATVEIRQGDFARAAEHLEAAQSYWRTDPARHALALSVSRVDQAQIERAAGSIDAAIRTLREAIAERTELLGEASDTLVLRQNLAAHLTGAQRPDEARQAFQEGWKEFERLERTRTPEALSFLTTWAVLDQNRGYLAEAELRVREVISLRRALYGESAQLAVALASLGRLLGQADRLEEALPILAEASRLAERDAGPHSAPAVLVPLYEADAHLLRGEAQPARDAVERAFRAAGDQYAPTHLITGRLLETRARVLASEGREAEAERDARAAEAIARAAGSAGDALLAQTLLDLGELAASTGRSEEALAARREALALRQRIAAPGTWLRAEAGLALAKSIEDSAAPETARELRREAASTLARELGATHPLARRAKGG